MKNLFFVSLVFSLFSISSAFACESDGDCGSNGFCQNGECVQIEFMPTAQLSNSSYCMAQTVCADGSRIECFAYGNPREDESCFSNKAEGQWVYCSGYDARKVWRTIEQFCNKIHK